MGFGISLAANPTLETCFYGVAGLDPDRTMRAFFGAADVSDFDLVDEFGNGIFDAAASRLGPVDVEQVYVFVPPLALGGSVVQNIRIASAMPSLVMLRDVWGRSWST